MKKLLSLLLCAGMICTITPISFVNANSSDTGYQQQNDENGLKAGIYGVIPENDVYLIENQKFKIELNFPEKIGINEFSVSVEVIEENNDNVNFFFNSFLTSDEVVTDHAYVEGEVYSEGSAKLNITVGKIYDSSVTYFDTLSVKVDAGELFVSKNEFNLSSDQLVISDYYGNPILSDVVDEFTIGLRRKDGTVINLSDSAISTNLEISSTNPEVATYGQFIMQWNELSPNISDWPYSEEFEIFYWDKAKELNSKYTSFSEFVDLLEEFCEMKGIECPGLGTGGEHADGIIARNPGTAYITISTGDDSVTVKVNVSNLSETPMNDLPSNFNGEYYSDSNENINVNLTQSVVVSNDIFYAAKDTGKVTTFNVLDSEGNLDYSWSFDGSEINKTDIDVNLKVNRNQLNVEDIKESTNIQNVLVLNFGHAGELPSDAKIKVYVGDDYQDGEKIYLNYWDENKKEASEVNDAIEVKDGYVEFSISHCVTYFLTSERITENNEEDEIIDNIPTDNPTGNDENNEVDNSKDNVTINDSTDKKTESPQTGGDNMIYYLVLLITSFLLMVSLRLKSKLEK